MVKELEEEIQKRLNDRNDYNDGVIDGLIIAIKILEKGTIQI